MKVKPQINEYGNVDCTKGCPEGYTILPVKKSDLEKNNIEHWDALVTFEKNYEKWVVK